MNRYRFSNPADMGVLLMEADANGQWVRWSDAQAAERVQCAICRCWILRSNSKPDKNGKPICVDLCVDDGACRYLVEIDQLKAELAKRNEWSRIQAGLPPAQADERQEEKPSSGKENDGLEAG